MPNFILRMVPNWEKGEGFYYAHGLLDMRKCLAWGLALRVGFRVEFGVRVYDLALEVWFGV